MNRPNPRNAARRCLLMDGAPEPYIETDELGMLRYSHATQVTWGEQVDQLVYAVDEAAGMTHVWHVEAAEACPYRHNYPLPHNWIPVINDALGWLLQGSPLRRYARIPEPTVADCPMRAWCPTGQRCGDCEVRRATSEDVVAVEGHPRRKPLAWGGYDGAPEHG